MKNLLGLFVSFIVVFATQAFAQADLSMIVSPSALRAYALSQATEVNAYISSVSMSGGSTTYDFRKWTGQRSSTDILELVKLLKLSGDTVDPKDSVQVSVSVNSPNGGTLFWGYTETTPVLINGVYSLPKEAGDIVFKLGDLVPIKFDKQISWAVIVAKDSNGNSFFYSLHSWDQTIYFPSQSAGLKNARIQVSFTDGTTVSWGIASGQILKTFPLSTSIVGKFENVVSFKNPTTVSVVVASVNRVGIIPTIEVVLDVGATVIIDIITSEGKRPTSFLLIHGSGVPVLISAEPGSGPSNVTLSKGITYVIPQWAIGDFSEPPPVIPNNGKG